MTELSPLPNSMPGSVFSCGRGDKLNISPLSFALLPCTCHSVLLALSSRGGLLTLAAEVSSENFTSMYEGGLRAVPISCRLSSIWLSSIHPSHSLEVNYFPATMACYEHSVGTIGAKGSVVYCRGVSGARVQCRSLPRENPEFDGRSYGTACVGSDMWGSPCSNWNNAKLAHDEGLGMATVWGQRGRPWALRVLL